MFADTNLHPRIPDTRGKATEDVECASQNTTKSEIWRVLPSVPGRRREVLKSVKYQDWNASFSYAPPLRDAVINTEELVSAVTTDSRGSGPWMRLSFRNGETMTVQGTPLDLCEKEA